MYLELRQGQYGSLELTLNFKFALDYGALGFPNITSIKFER